jgi:hypothetical protein
MTKKLTGFALDRKRASEAAKNLKASQTPEERVRLAKLAAKARWDKQKRDGMSYEEIK